PASRRRIRVGTLEHRYEGQDSQNAKRRRYLGGAPLHHRPGRGDERGHPHARSRSRGCAADQQRAQTVMPRYCFAVVLLALSGRARPPKPPLARAAGYLWNQQAEDGGWHSHTYGLLRSGQALTPFVLEALLQVPEQVYSPPVAKLDGGLA